MAFCGQCGQKNPDGAKFCSACGAPLVTSVDATVSGSQETPSKPERITLHRESTPPPPPPRRDSTSESRREAGSPWQNVSRNHDRQPRQEPRQEMPSRPQRGFEKPAKKGGKLGGCLKKLILWLIGIIVVLGLLVWGFRSCLGGSGGGDEDQTSSGLLSKDYERSFDEARFVKLRNRHEFPLSTVDVSLQPGEYKAQLEKDGVKGDITLKIEPTESDNKQIIGRAEFGARVEGMGERSQTLSVTYAGNSVYVLYPEEEEIGSLNGMVLFVSPDGEKLDCYERGEIIMSFKLK